jgi:hypothetical protein
LLQKCNTLCKRRERDDDYDNGRKGRSRWRRIRGGKKERNKKLQLCSKIRVTPDRIDAGEVSVL